MGKKVSYQLRDGVAGITMDDGRSNVMSSTMQAELTAALDRAQADQAVVLLNGRDGVFSAGFDVADLRAGGPGAQSLVRGGFELLHRLLSFPAPVVMACHGHAIAMGAFLLACGDYRIGAAGPFRFVANEVALGITVPQSSIEILRHRLTPSALTRAVSLAESFSPDNAVEAGILDAMVAGDELDAAARRVANNLADLDLAAHTATKLRIRQDVLTAVRSSIDTITRTPAR